MSNYFVRRVLETIPLLLVISFLIFMFIHLIPGDPVRNIAGVEATPAELDAIRESMGLNRPLHQQYFSYLNNLLHGDWGTSYKSRMPVSEMFVGRLGTTMKLTFFAILWSMIAGVGIGVISAVKRGTFVDYFFMLVAISGISIPGFWLGLVLIQIFSVKLGWVPTGGLNTWRSYILPSFTLGTGIMAVLARFSRSSLLDSLGENYVRTARAKGQKERLVIFLHAFRNSLVQVVTVIGLQIGGLLAGSILIETVFTIPGLGRLLVDSIAFRDYEVVQALLLFFSFEYIVINLIVDLLYGVLNPKIRLK